ncbi:MAG: molybdopterin-dependent oxidoreductase [Planctomycetota bacterium]|nr:molybdopterin-dependent oxidoreductase [Planctomycetota bacterium]
MTGAGEGAVHRTTCPLDCPDACGVLVETDAAGAFASLRGDPSHPWSRGVLCGKTALYGEVVRAPNRLLHPLVRRHGELVRASWDTALDLVAEKVGPLAGRDVLALSYGGSMGLVQRKFPNRVMNALGATHHDGGICDATADAGYQSVLGRCLGPDMDDVDGCDLLCLWGCDMARTVQHLQPRAKRLQERGVPVVVIDVWRTDTARDVERRGGRAFVIRPGTDAALALCLARLAFERGAVDRAYLAAQCVGADEFERHVRGAHDVAWAARITGLAVDEIEQLAALLFRSRKPFVKTGVGWTRRRNGGNSMRAVCALAAILGHGDRVHFESYAHFGLAEEVVHRPDLRPMGAPTEEVSQVGLGKILEEGRFRAVFVWCHDPAVTIPDSARFRRGFARDDLFTVVHDHFLTETAALADVVLPATTFVEHADVYRSYGHRCVQRARAIAKAPGEARSNVDTFAGLAKRLGLPRATWDVSADSLCDELLAASRSRFTDDEFARIACGEPVKLAPRAFGGWGTPSGRIELASSALERAGSMRLPTYVPEDLRGEPGEFELICSPSVHTHNATFSHSGRHAQKAGAPRAFLHPRDLARLGLAAGGRVRLANRRATVTLAVAPDDGVPQGRVRVDGLPRGADVPEGHGVNALVAGDVSDIGGGNVLYSTRCDLSAAD